MSPLTTALVGIVVAVCARAETVTVFLSAAQGQPAAPLEVMKREAAELLQPAGIRLEWRELESRRTDESFPQLIVAKLVGSCTLWNNKTAAVATGDSLAFTHTVGDSILPFTEIQCDALSSLLASRISPETAQRKQLLLGRAMARVLAHELYHILSQEKGHTGSGVSKVCFRTSDLLAEKFSFHREALASMRRELAPEPVSEDSGDR